MSETQEVLRDVLILKSPADTDPQWIGELGQHGFAVRDCGCMPSFLRVYRAWPAPHVVVAGGPDMVEDRVAQVRLAAPHASIVALVSPSPAAGRLRVMEAGADACHDAAMDTRELALVLARCGRQGEYASGLDIAGRCADLDPDSDRSPGHRLDDGFHDGERAPVGFAADTDAGPDAAANTGGGRAKWRLLDNGRRLRGPCGRCLSLTVKEGELVSDLMRSRDHLQSRSTLARNRRGSSGQACSERSIDVRVSRLRRKAKHFGMHLPVLSVRGCGYLFYGELEE